MCTRIRRLRMPMWNSDRVPCPRLFPLLPQDVKGLFLFDAALVMACALGVHFKLKYIYNTLVHSYTARLAFCIGRAEERLFWGLTMTASQHLWGPLAASMKSVLACTQYCQMTLILKWSSTARHSRFQSSICFSLVIRYSVRGICTRIQQSLLRLYFLCRC